MVIPSRARGGQDKFHNNATIMPDNVPSPRVQPLQQQPAADFWVSGTFWAENIVKDRLRVMRNVRILLHASSNSSNLATSASNGSTSGRP